MRSPRARREASQSCCRSSRRGARRATTWIARTYADPDVAALVNERFVPIRVDADRRPDISERYALGGLAHDGVSDG